MDGKCEMYLARAEACRRKAERAFGPADRTAWLELADAWLDLMKAMREGGETLLAGIGSLARRAEASTVLAVSFTDGASAGR